MPRDQVRLSPGGWPRPRVGTSLLGSISDKYLLPMFSHPCRHVDSALRNLVLLMVLPLVTSRRAEDVTEVGPQVAS